MNQSLYSSMTLPELFIEKRKAKEEDELTQMVERMKEKTEALRLQNQEERARRQYRNVHNLDHYGRPRI